MSELFDDIDSFYEDDPQLGDIVFLKHTFDDASVRGEVIGIERFNGNRGLAPDGTYELLLYTGLRIKLGGMYDWFDIDEWEITDKLRGWEYKKLPPERVKPNQE